MKLQGIRVLDLSQFLPGPHLTMMMADHGAEVIAVEPSNGVGEPTRQIGERAGDTTVYHRNVSRGKKSLRLNLKSQEGRNLFHKLAETSDVIVESFRPGVVKRLGVDYDRISSSNPRIVYCSLSAFGQSESEYRDRPAHDLAVQALAGTAALGLGLDDGKPAVPNLPGADMTSSLMALVGVLMALYRRQVTGRGDYIDLAMYDAVLGWTPNVTGPVFANDKAPRPKSMRTLGGAALYSIYETQDGGFISLGGSEKHFAKIFFDALGRPDLYDLAIKPPGPDQDPVKSELRTVFLQRTLNEWIAFLEPLDICWAPVRTLKEAYSDPFTRDRNMVLQDADGQRHIGVPIKFRHEPADPRLEVPEYGEHSRALAQDVGLPDPQIDAMINNKII